MRGRLQEWSGDKELGDGSDCGLRLKKIKAGSYLFHPRRDPCLKSGELTEDAKSMSARISSSVYAVIFGFSGSVSEFFNSIISFAP